MSSSALTCLIMISVLYVLPVADRQIDELLKLFSMLLSANRIEEVKESNLGHVIESTGSKNFAPLLTINMDQAI